MTILGFDAACAASTDGTAGAKAVLAVRRDRRRSRALPGASTRRTADERDDDELATAERFAPLIADALRAFEADTHLRYASDMSRRAVEIRTLTHRRQTSGG